MEIGIAVTLALFVAGVLVTTGRLLERMTVLRRDLESMRGALSEIQRVLYTTVGGRRAIRPIAAGELAEGERET